MCRETNYLHSIYERVRWQHALLVLLESSEKRTKKTERMNTVKWLSTSAFVSLLICLTINLKSIPAALFVVGIVGVILLPLFHVRDKRG